MSLIFKRPWTRQPQNATKALPGPTGLWLVGPPSGISPNLVTGEAVTFQGSGVTDISTGYAGPVVGRNLNSVAAASRPILGKTYNLFDETLQAATILVVGRRNGTTGERGLWFGASGGAGGIGLVPASGLGGSIWQAAGRSGGLVANASLGILTGFTYSTVPQVYVVTTVQNLLSCWQNGVRTAGPTQNTWPYNTGGGALPWTSGDFGISGGGWDSFVYTNSSFYAVATWNRVLSDAEIIAYSRNPWQLFAPLQRTIWAPAAAAAGPTYTLTAASGSFTLSGQTATLTAARKIAAASGSFALAGQAVAFNAGRKMVAASGAFTLAGQAAALKISRKLAAASGTFTLAGQNTSFVFTRKLAAASGSFALSGQAATLKASRKLTAANGSYALAGQDATLTYTPVGGPTYTLSAASGSFALSGQDAALKASRKMVASSGSFALAGQAATLTYTPRVLVLSAGSGSFSLAGQDATLTYSGATSGGNGFDCEAFDGDAFDTDCGTTTRGGGFGGFKRHHHGERKGYIIKGHRYWLTEEELALMLAQMAEVVRTDVKEVTKTKPRVISKRTWVELTETLDRLTPEIIDYDEDEDEALLLASM